MNIILAQIYEYYIGLENQIFPPTYSSRLLAVAMPGDLLLYMDQADQVADLIPRNGTLVRSPSCNLRLRRLSHSFIGWGFCGLRFSGREVIRFVTRIC